MLPLQSEQIDQLTAAFVLARQKAKPFKEDGKANYGSYVSIDEIRSCTNESLLANGLSLTQTRTFVEGQIMLVTRLTHISGQWQCSYVPLIIADNPKNVDQAYGASMTYQRRYELYGLFAFKGEELDPDAEAEPKSNSNNKSNKNDKPDYDQWLVKDFNIKALRTAFAKFENPGILERDYLKVHGVSKIEELRQGQAKEIIADLMEQLK